MKEIRIHQIENYIYEKETVSLTDLAEEFGVSLNTIRRDINYLEESGVLKKVYGGVVSNRNKELTAYDYRESKFEKEKEDIAKIAASRIEHNDHVFIDSGTTTNKILNFVPQDLAFTVLTTNLDIVIASLNLPNVEVIIIGNRLNKPTRSFLNDNIMLMVNKNNQRDNCSDTNYNITKAFMATTGTSIKSGVTNSDYHEFATKKLMANKAHEVYVLADESKFGKEAILTYADYNDVDAIITNRTPAAEYVKNCEVYNVDIITPNSG